MSLGSLQGRVGAFNHATNDMGPELISKLCAFDQDFKTCLQYGVQAITTSTASTELLKMYIDVLRPKIMEGDKEPLFISLAGSAIRVGRYVTAFFKRVSGLNISTTTIRSIVATESARLLGNGDISIEEQASVQNINGHSGITAHKYYQKRSRIKDTQNVLSVHRKLLGNFDTADIENCDIVDMDYEDIASTIEASDTSFDMLASPSFPNQEDNLYSPLVVQIDASFPRVELRENGSQSFVAFETSVTNLSNTDSWLSPNSESVRRVPWTEQEIHIVGTWCKLYREQHPGNNNVVANCLHYIRNHSDVKKHFHPHHIADSTRLRWGWQKFQEQDQGSVC